MGLFVERVGPVDEQVDGRLPHHALLLVGGLETGRGDGRLGQELQEVVLGLDAAPLPTKLLLGCL